MGKALTRNWQLMQWVSAAATVLACGGKALDIGSDDASAGSRTLGGASTLGGTAATAGASVLGGTGGNGAIGGDPYADVRWPEPQACEPAPDSPLVGTWQGRYPLITGETAEAVLTIAGLTPDGVPCGTFRVGDGEPLAPPTDPDAYYPEGAPMLPSSDVGNPFTSPWPGYDYQLLKVISEGTRLAFMLSFDEILRPWCQLQTPYADTNSCLPLWTSGKGSIGGSGNGSVCSIEGPDLPETEVPCWKMQYCSNATCFCVDGECDATLSMTPFELHWDERSLEGTVNGGTNLIFLDPVE